MKSKEGGGGGKREGGGEKNEGKKEGGERRENKEEGGKRKEGGPSHPSHFCLYRVWRGLLTTRGTVPP